MTVVIVKMEPDSSVKKEVICRHCGVTLSYVPVDVKSRKVSDYSGSSEIYRYIKCANCECCVGVR